MTSQRLIRNQDLAVQMAERWSWAVCQWTMIPKWLMANYVYKLKQLAETLSGSEEENLRIVSCVREKAFVPQGFQRSWQIHKWHRINSWWSEHLFCSLPTGFPPLGVGHHRHRGAWPASYPRLARYNFSLSWFISQCLGHMLVLYNDFWMFILWINNNEYYKCQILNIILLLNLFLTYLSSTLLCRMHFVFLFSWFFFWVETS